MIRWRPILTATNLAFGLLGVGVIAATGGLNNVLVPFFIVGWLAFSAAFVTEPRAVRAHVYAGLLLILWLLAAGAVESAFFTAFLSIWLVGAASLARRLT